MQGFYHLLFYVAPLIPLPIALWVHGRKWSDLRWVVRFSVGYVVLQALAFYFVYYCFSRGYQDAIMSLMFPQAFAFFGLPVSWIVFICSFAARERSVKEPQGS